MRIISAPTTASTTATGYTTKGISAFSIMAGVKASDLTGVKIKIEVVKQASNGNIDVTGGFVPILQLISLHRGVITSDADYNVKVVIPFTPDGKAYKLKETGEQIVISLSGLTATKTYMVDGFEDAQSTNKLFKYEMKPIAAAEIDYNVNTSIYDVVSFTDTNTVAQMTFHYPTGQAKYTYDELKMLSQTARPIANYSSAWADSLTQITGFFALPIHSVQSVNVQKDNTTIVNFYGRYIVQSND
ncbi:hypothetical protein [Flavobacterium sp. XGLA_31]|uniref:hypothetical protein n=1 Tax=Flavobacterium sp. XGLA_31 TaxID=3447666 RepID=UPI003F40C5DA